jgi:glutathione synthase/RimK-type ligase-like ATP-grasp enzyme
MLADRGEVLDVSELTGAWHRRLDIGADIPKAMPRNLRGPSIEESRRTLFGLFASLPCLVVDPTKRLRHAEHKQLQLEVARRVGLDVPRTLVTNDAQAVRAFWEECSGRVIAKMMTGFAVVEDGRDHVVFTNALAEEDLGALDQLALCPMTFQERLDKALELRVTIVGERVFAASIDSGKLERSRVDWRRAGLELIADWKPCELPRDVERGLLALMDHFGLNYGAIDVIVTPEGRHVFLEVNPSGEFFWLDRDARLPISEALADVLLGLAPRRLVARPTAERAPRAS